MRKYFGLMLISLGLLGGLVHAMDLDSTAWRIHEKGKTDTEDLIFVNGQFTSSGCIPYGFLTSGYTSEKKGENFTWAATQINKDNEKMVWNGETKGSEISGTFVYTDKKGQSWTSEWMGKKIKAK